MKERPILFSAPMVRAILEGRKTQTRRAMRVQPEMVTDRLVQPWEGDPAVLMRLLEQTGKRCPYGQPGDREWRNGPIPETGWYYVRGLLAPSVGGDDRPVWVNAEYFTFGFSEQDDPEAIELDTCITPENVEWKRCGDRLWVRETWGLHDQGFDTQSESTSAVYRADINRPTPNRWRPSIHMPRWASRITLEIVRVRVERLQDIGAADALAEGIERLTHAGLTTYRNYALSDEWASVSPMLESPIDSYKTLWESINGPGSWDANPWVWVIEFKAVTP